MGTLSRWLAPAAVLGALSLGPAHGFEIQTTLSDPCHERITLAAYGVLGPPFGEAGHAAPLRALVLRAEGLTLPGDRATVAFVADLAARFNFADRSPAARWVIASIIAGAREPDTRGFAILAFNEARITHIDDDLQALHSLRRSTDDGAPGTRQAIDAARAVLLDATQAAHDAWWHAPIRPTRWAFPFYGEQTVQAFGPGFHLGMLGHTAQDSYTHTIRDADLNIVSVLNFAEAGIGPTVERRDGLPHSARMDHCDVGGNAFDRLRVHAARDATIDLVAQAVATFTSQVPPTADDVSPALDHIYRYRQGCTADNDYCGSAWLPEVHKEPTEPIELWFCAATDGGPPAWLWGLLLLGGLSRRRAQARG
jgi:uncharacterized protein (TIGR03382 family)